MSIQIFNLTKDHVISGYVGLGQSSYEYTIKNIHPLINRFNIPEKFIDAKFYVRLERDILNGCILPPISLAFLEDNFKFENAADLTNYVNKNISQGYILDGV